MIKKLNILNSFRRELIQEFILEINFQEFAVEEIGFIHENSINLSTV